MSLRVRKIFASWTGVLPVCLALAVFLPGCFGVSANPFRLGNLPGNDIVRTHGKPRMGGHYGNFDPQAAQLTINPKEAVNQVRTQHVLVATVCDKDGNGLRNRRVEWHVEGVGHIVEVDESGFFPGRGYLVDDKYAISYTNYREHKLTRGNDDPKDDIPLKPGQTWCTITSAEEGESLVTCYAPGIYDWQKHKVFAIKRWVDAVPKFPEPIARNPAGSPHQYETRIFHDSDKSPAAGYLVEYRILDGPPAVFEQGGGTSVKVISDQDGFARATLRQLHAIPGSNRVSIDVVRQPDKPTGKFLAIAHSEVVKMWIAPQITINKIGPQQVAVGEPFKYTVSVMNIGTVETPPVTVRDTMPPGLEVKGTSVQAAVQGADLLWQTPVIAPGGTWTVELTCVANVPGTVVNSAQAGVANGQAVIATATTQVVTADLSVAKVGPTTGVIGQPMMFNILLLNKGNAPAKHIVLTDSPDAAFSHQWGSGPIQNEITVLQPGESKSIPITMIPKFEGVYTNRVSVVAEGGLRAEASHQVTIIKPSLKLTKSGPQRAYVNSPVTFKLEVVNNGQVPVNNIVVQDQFPNQLRPIASAPNTAIIRGQIVDWMVGTLNPGQTRSIEISAMAVAKGDNVCNMASVTADGAQATSNSVCLDIGGIPALSTQIIDLVDPVSIGSNAQYLVQITNTGSSVMNNVVLDCLIPQQFSFDEREGAQAPVGAHWDPQSRVLRFEPFNGLAPEKSIRYLLTCKAIHAGDARFETKVTSSSHREPVSKIESTRVYDSNERLDPNAMNRGRTQPQILPAGQDDLGTMKPANFGEQNMPMQSTPTSEKKSSGGLQLDPIKIVLPPNDPQDGSNNNLPRPAEKPASKQGEILPRKVDPTKVALTGGS